MFEPGEWIPILALLLVGGCTAVGIAGAWAVGRARGLSEAARRQAREGDTDARIERMERSLHAISEEIERLGEVQRFALKVIAEKAGVREEWPLSPPRVTTPH